MIVLINLRCKTLVLLMLITPLCLSQFAWGQSQTLGIRDSEGVRNREFNEEVQQVGFQQINPQLLQILREWEKTTKDYEKLSGEHRRFVYDSVFQVEKRADGHFYYEAPDKGRIDIKEVKIPDGAKSQKLSPQGKPYSLQSDIPEKWICDGQQIAQAIVPQKQYQIHQIPQQDQGINIMDGPLPFLFGLPAQKAIQRYQFELLQETNEKAVWLKVMPKRKQDAANWREAQVILDRKSFLPIAVKLINPPGTTETVYSFKNLKANQSVVLTVLFGEERKPFDIANVLKGYKRIIQADNGNTETPATQVGKQKMVPPQQQPQQVAQLPPQQPKKQPIMPQVVNHDWKKVKDLFEGGGYQVEFRKAGPATNQAQVFTVAKQEPAPGTQLQAGQKVIFYLFEEIKSASRP